MEEKLLKAQDIFLDKINQICNKFGLNNIMAQLYAMLYLSNNALSLDDMVERLKISKGSASTNIRELERYGAVRKVWVKGSRKDYYEAETDITKVIMERIRSMAQTRLSELDDIINISYEGLGSVDTLDKDTKESVTVFRQRLDDLRGLHGRAQTLFNMLNSPFLMNTLRIKGHNGNKG